MISHRRRLRTVFQMSTSFTIGAGLVACSNAAGGSVLPPPPPPTVATIDVVPSSTSVVVGATRQLAATLKDASGTTLAGQTVTWSSANTSVATVTTGGLVSGVAPGGPVTITATSGGVNGAAAVTVTAAPVATVVVSPNTTSIRLGESRQLATALKDADGNTLLGRVVTWASSNPAIASGSAAGLVTSVAVGGPVTITASSEGIDGAAVVTVTQSSFGAWLLRRQLTVSTGSAAAPSGYSVAVQFDHASLVTGGKALPGGNDVRVAYWTGTAWIELDRVLDAASSWNSSATTIWFRTQDAIPANTSDNNYYLYYSNPAGFTPPANPSQVFLISDGFETANFNQWISSDMGGTLWQVDNTHAHSGTFAATYPAEATSQHAIVVNPPLDVGDVYVESWWYFSNLDPSLNVGVELRRASLVTDRYEVLTCCSTGVLVWQINTVLNHVHTAVASPAGALTPGNWSRVGIGMAGTTLRVFVNGAQVNVATGLTDLVSGNVGLEKVTVPAGSGFWIDDIVVRRFAFPEPTVALGGETVPP